MNRVLLSIPGGLISGFVMDGVTTLIMRAQSESLEREQEVRGEGQPAALARRAGAMLGVDVSDRAAKVAGTVFHRMTGIIAGPFVGGAAARGYHPVRNAVLAAMVFWLLFDEGVSWAMDPDQARRYPAATHLRGLMGHLAYGATMGVIVRVAISARSSSDRPR